MTKTIVLQDLGKSQLEAADRVLDKADDYTIEDVRVAVAAGLVESDIDIDGHYWVPTKLYLDLAEGLSR